MTLWRPYNLNCLLDSLQAIMLENGRDMDDVARHLVQPLDFGFEVELGSRDWWVGGSSGVRFQWPIFRQGLTACWVDVTGQSFEEVVKKYLDRDLPVIFQTEWMLVPFSPHFGYNRGGIHVSIAFSLKDGKVDVRDRWVGDGKDFSEDFRASLPVSTYAKATAERFRVLDWSLVEPPLRIEDEILDVLRNSVAFMRNTDDFFAPGPHVHIATGMAGIRYFARTIDTYAPQFATDPQTRMLLGVRLVDSVRTVMGDRMILDHALGLTSLPVEAVRQQLGASLNTWRKLAGRLRRESRAATPDLHALAQRIDAIAEIEEKLIQSIEELLATWSDSHVPAGEITADR